MTPLIELKGLTICTPDRALVEDGDLSELELEDVERRRAREQPIGFEAFQRILVHLVVERARY